MAGIGRVKSIDIDLSMSGEDTGVAVGRVQSYARTRPRADVRLAAKQTLNVRAPLEGLGVSANGAMLLRDSTRDRRRTKARCNRTHACAMPARVESLRRYQRAERALRPGP